MGNWFRLALFFCASAVAGSAAADFDSAVDLGVVHTDNLTLAQANTESATAWRLTPEFRATAMSSRLTGLAAYRLEAYHYQERDDTEVFHQFRGELGIGVVPERFSLNMGASRSQAIVDPQAAIPVTNLVVSANRVDLDEYFFGPTLRIPISDNTYLSSDIRRDAVRYGQHLLTIGAQEDYDKDTANLSIDNYRKKMGFAWAFRYQSEKTEYQVQILPFEHRQADVELGFWTNDRSRVFAAAGRETPWNDPANVNLADPFWEVGFSHASDKLSAEFAVGERSYGSSRRGRVETTFGRSKLSISYNETPTTNSSDRYVRGLLSPDAQLDYLFRAGSIERYIQKRAEVNLDFNLQRTSISLRGFDENREDRTRIDGTPLPDESQSGGDLTVTWKFGIKTTVGLETRAIQRTFEDGTGSDLTINSLNAGHQLGPRTNLTVKYEHWQEKSKAIFSPNYDASVISAAVTRAFR